LRVIALLTCLWWAGAVVCANSADLTNVEMMLMPGSGKAIPMPPKVLRIQIERRMKTGDVPDTILVSGNDIERKCRTEGYLLGCVTELSCKLGLVYVRKGLSRELEHMARVHEIAHCLYGWKH
jgi:hypothetical protein